MSQFTSKITVFWLLIIVDSTKSTIEEFFQNLMMDIELKTNRKGGDEVHVPVLVDEVLKYLNLTESSVVADLTMGAGGHSSEIAKRIPRGRLLSLDRDDSIIPLARKKLNDCENVVIVNADFAQFKIVAEQEGFERFDGLLLDLGLSSWQLDNNDRGFSYASESKLDMRMGGNEKTAAMILNNYSEQDLRKVFVEYGDIKRSSSLVKEIVSFRRAKSFTYVSDLLGVVNCFANFKEKKRNVVARVWQALRMEVNDEIDQLKTFLSDAVDLLNEGGRLCVISFHSGEDRVVKEFFKTKANPCSCPKNFPKCICGKRKELKIITKKPIVPSQEEVGENIRSHSAKLRVAEKI